MPGRNKKDTQINLRLTDQGKALLYGLQDHLGFSQASLIEMLLREEARRRGLLQTKPIVLPRKPGEPD